MSWECRSETGRWLHVWSQERSFAPDGRSGQTCFVACLAGVGGSAGGGVDSRLINGTIGSARGMIGGRGELGQGASFIKHAIPMLELVVELEFLFDVVEGVEHELADVGEGSGIALPDALLGEGLEELAEHKVDVGGGEEVAIERGGEFRAEASGLEELHFVASVEEAKPAVVAMTKHTAAAAVGSLEGASVGGFGSGIGRWR